VTLLHRQIAHGQRVVCSLLTGSILKIASGYRLTGEPSQEPDVKQPIPVSFMAVLAAPPRFFFLESLINELADAVGIDPYQYRRRMLSHDSHAIAVLDRVTDAAGWNKPVPKGIYRARL
jgi:hypothetical protein